MSDSTRLQPGQMVPDFTLPSLEGAEVSLSSFRGGKVVIFMWASW